MDFFLFFFEFQVNIVEEAWDESQLNKEKCVCIFIFFNGLMKFKLFYNQLIEKTPVSLYSFHRERETEMHLTSQVRHHTLKVLLILPRGG